MRSFRSALVSLLALALLVQGVVPANASVAFDSLAAATFLTAGVGAVLLMIKGPLISLIVSFVEMIVDGDFSQRAFSKLTQNLVLSIVAGPYIVKLVKKLRIKKILRDFDKWFRKLVKKAVSTFCGSSVEFSIVSIQDIIYGVQPGSISKTIGTAIKK